MAYEHLAEVRSVSKNLMDIFNLLLDEVPNQEQLALMLAEAAGVFSVAMSAIDAEDKREFKAKFLAKVGLSLTNRALDSLLPDSES